MDINPFTPSGNTTFLAVTTGTASIALPTMGSGYGGTVARIFNIGPAVAFIAFGASTVTSVLPTAGNPANGYPIAIGGEIKIPVTAGQFIAAITIATTATLYITVGQGGV